MWKKKDVCRDRWKDRRTSLACIFLSLPVPVWMRVYDRVD